MPDESAGVSSGPSVFKVHGEVYRFMQSMHDGQQPADGLQTFFADETMQADVGSFSAPSTRRRPHKGPAARYVRSLVSGAV